MDDRPLKRVRQACQNCRRKKTRCSGERPICAFCARLQQDCYYDDSWFASVQVEPTPRRIQTVTASGANDSTLATRVATIESQVGMLESSGALSSLGNLDISQATLDGPITGSLNETPPNQNNFNILPGPEIVQSLVKTYFEFCHCQPYCYFHEASFHRRLAENTLPTWLLLAVIAAAAEFSDEPYFRGEQVRAADCYASIAWRDISDNMFQEDGSVDLSTVQATNLLSVIDFSAGRYKQAWVKIGLAVRFAESLDLLSAPDYNLPFWQQEEHRRTFWSVYLLDRIVSCSPERTPTIQDADCTLGLPVDPVGSTGNSTADDDTTLARLVGQLDDMSRVGYSGFLCLIASSLGKIQRYSLRRSVTAGSLLPWNSQSDFASIYSALLTFESYSPVSLTNFDFVLELESVEMGQKYSSQSELGILASSHALYYLCQCLLHHPFLIRHRLQSVKVPIPPSFLEDILRRSRKNATSLTLMLHSLLKRRLCLASSIGYCAVVAGVIHRIFEFDEDPSVQEAARASYKLSLEFLQRAPVRWRHYPRMVSAVALHFRRTRSFRILTNHVLHWGLLQAQALASFSPDPAATSAMINPSLCTSLAPHPDAQAIWRLLDYGKLSQHAEAPIGSRQEIVPSGNIDFSDWAQVLETPTDWIE
ncbi:fungal-specific transcription factor domain-containing protein [Dactylonectria macrodidyma]|uniref:Fungal-specific transcription factor domain-containing protein n=1 Tax=Dactylonectria macrodidyma TaxID=307937 RepID=A0A9P9III8_9HYPO|nr:fungal-specific transcription factor domain-containing protein [Dactylonectria macrodidyma]